MKNEPPVGDFARILLVEDNPADVNMLRESFRESKIANELHVVNDGEGALEFLYRKGKFAAAPKQHWSLKTMPTTWC